jgi:hypothetical protein
MDARIYSVIRRDGTTFYRLNIFASIFILLVEIVIVLIDIILAKVNASAELLIVFAVLSIGWPVIALKYYQKVFKYHRVVRFKDIYLTLLAPPKTVVNNYHGRRKKLAINTINISAHRKRG